MTDDRPQPPAPHTPREFHGQDLRGARFRACDLSGVVVRGSDVAGLEVDSPWLLEDPDATLLVNGVNVAPLVDAALDERFPGRALRRAEDPAGLREAWAALERAWTALDERVVAMPDGTADASVDGEWSYAQTLRHLVMATDTWLGRAILGRSPAEAYHPAGLPDASYAADGRDPSVFADTDPDLGTVRAARADRQAMVRDLLASVTPDDLGGTRPSPWAPEHTETVLSCLRTILEEEWEHHRYAVRDLDALA